MLGTFLLLAKKSLIIGLFFVLFSFVIGMKGKKIGQQKIGRNKGRLSKVDKKREATTVNN